MFLLQRNKDKKIMVFFSSCNSVKFHAELLNYIDIPVSDIHGRQKQAKRTSTFFQASLDSSTSTLISLNLVLCLLAASLHLLPGSLVFILAVLPYRLRNFAMYRCCCTGVGYP